MGRAVETDPTPELASQHRSTYTEKLFRMHLGM